MEEFYLFHTQQILYLGKEKRVRKNSGNCCTPFPISSRLLARSFLGCSLGLSSGLLSTQYSVFSWAVCLANQMYFSSQFLSVFATIPTWPVRCILSVKLCKLAYLSLNGWVPSLGSCMEPSILRCSTSLNCYFAYHCSLSCLSSFLCKELCSSQLCREWSSLKGVLPGNQLHSHSTE